jgi:hypothetical protein
MLVSIIAGLSLISLPHTGAFYSVSYDEAHPSFLKLAHAADWIEDKGPLRSEPVMTILSWDTFFTWDHLSLKGEAAQYLETDLGACRLTFDHSLISTADVVWFGMVFKDIDLARWLVPRPRGALWAYFSLEPPTHFNRYDYHQLKLLNSSINMMATYQWSSDFTLARQYGFFTRRATALPNAQVPDWSKKTRLMVSMNSDFAKEAPSRNSRILVCFSSINLSMFCSISKSHQSSGTAFSY